MIVTKAHKIRLNPTPEQEQYFWQAAGVARFAFNWGVERYNAGLESKEKVSGRGLKKAFNQEKPEWVNDVTCWAYQGAFDDLQAAYRMYFTKKKNGTLNKPKDWKPRKDGKPFGWPRFKSRNKTTPAFYLANISLHFEGNEFWFDKKRVGWVNMTEPLRFDGRVLGGRISYRAGHWWLSVQVETETDDPEPNDNAVGVDLGIKYLAVTSDGVIFENPKPLEKAKRKLRRLQRKLDRQKRANNPDNYNENGTIKAGIKLEWHQSENMKKTKAAIAKAHYRVACIRNEASHQMTTESTRDYGLIGIEDLNIKGMQKNRRLSKAISDAALYEKRRQLEYKAAWNGGEVVVIDRWFPSSKRCNNCGEAKPELKLSEREWTCEHCGSVNHRDANAARNIRDEALKISGRTTQADSINGLTLTLSDSGVVEQP